jgi:hypothetical protein
MKTIEAVIIVLIIVLGASLVLDYSLYTGVQQLRSTLSDLNESFYNLNQRYNELAGLSLSQNASSASTTNESLGLNFNMALNTTFLQSGQAISITLDERNLIDSFNNITASNNWAYSGFQPIGPCAPSPGLYNLPFTVAIVPGYYSILNLPEVSSLPIFFGPSNVPIFCIFLSPPSEYDFYPLSNNVIIHVYEMLNESTLTTLTFSGYYNTSDPIAPSISQPSNNSTNQNITVTPFNLTQIVPYSVPMINFPPGVYTIIGGDEWGQLILLHFVVI